MSRSAKTAAQPSLALYEATNEVDNLLPHEKVYAAAFRKLYYHLYSNSNASRAERIISDLSNLLLCKIASERNGGLTNLQKFLSVEC